MRNALRAKIVGTAFVGVLVGTTGLALAGELPGAAQSVASTMLAKIGISVPGPNSHAGTHPNVRGGSGAVPTVSPSSPPADTKGSLISQLARTTTATGVAKGAAISTLASGGKSKAGQHGQASQRAHPPVPTPNGGGTGMANTARGGASSHGTGTADGASGGHSGAGSGNAGGH